MDELFRGVQRNETQEYCFGLNFDSNFTYNATDDPNAYYYLDIQFSFNKGMVVDTNSPPYNEHVMSPDIASWGNWQQSGITALFPYLTEFMGRYIRMRID